MKQVYLFLAVMLLLCLAPMPYGYFMLVRFVMMVVFGLMAYRYYQEQKTVATWTFCALALLFQPIYKIALGRTLWNVVDVVVALLLIVLFIMEQRRGTKSETIVETLPPAGEPEKGSNTFEFKCARIRGAFVGQFDDRMAKHYYIDGLRGKPKKISLPRHLVSWEG